MVQTVCSVDSACDYRYTHSCPLWLFGNLTDLFVIQDADFVEKIEVMLVFHHAQRLVDASSSALSALFLVQACRAVASPEDEHYPTFLRYLLQRPALDFEDVPLLYPMLYPTDQSRAPIDRRWILQLLVDGTTLPKVSATCCRSPFSKSD